VAVELKDEVVRVALRDDVRLAEGVAVARHVLDDALLLARLRGVAARHQ